MQLTLHNNRFLSYIHYFLKKRCFYGKMLLEDGREAIFEDKVVLLYSLYFILFFIHHLKAWMFHLLE